MPNESGSLVDPHADLPHYPQSCLRWGSDDKWMPKSQTILLKMPAQAAIVFVHGWGGSAGATWEAFPKALATLPANASSDVYLLDYPSTDHQVPFCAAKFRDFLLDLLQHPMDRIVNPSLPRGASLRASAGRYQRIILVAHSMGAVVARRALLDVELDIERSPPGGLTADEFAEVKLLFFAPAHLGSDLPLLIGSGFGLDYLPGVKLLGNIILLWKQSLRDLEAGSETLQKLLSDCRELRGLRQARNADVSHLRAFVYHAAKDRTVGQDNFDHDFPVKTVMGKNHRTVCKPTESYLTPVQGLQEVLSL